MNRLQDRCVAAAYRGVTTALEPAIRFIYAAWGMGDPRALRTERLARNELTAVDSWWHAASLGEIAALGPILHVAQVRQLTGRIVVTTTSRTGRDAARRLAVDERRASLAPLDLPRTMSRALDARQPKALVLVETELWPNWLRIAMDHGTRVGVVNGRVSGRNWSRWRRGAPVAANVMARIQAVAARTQDDAERFIAMGVPEQAVRVTGNSKHDLDADARVIAMNQPLPWPRARLWTVGSLRPGEEDPVLDAFVSLRKRFDDLRLILVPRHFDDEPRFLAALGRRGLTVSRRSQYETDNPAASVLLVDTYGELRLLYAASVAAFVGGTLVPIGGHNVMEPAAAGVPILVGPHHETVMEEVKELAQAGALRIVRDSDALTKAMGEWLTSDAARDQAARASQDVAESMRGATNRVIDWLVERGVLPAV